MKDIQVDGENKWQILIQNAKGHEPNCYRNMNKSWKLYIALFIFSLTVTTLTGSLL